MNFEIFWSNFVKVIMSNKDSIEKYFFENFKKSSKIHYTRVYTYLFAHASKNIFIINYSSSTLPSRADVESCEKHTLYS